VIQVGDEVKFKSHPEAQDFKKAWKFKSVLTVRYVTDDTIGFEYTKFVAPLVYVELAGGPW